jgi:hypothetical protein
MVVSAVAAGIAIWKAKEAKRSSQASLAASFLKSKQEILTSALQQLHEIDFFPLMIDYTSALTGDPVQDTEAGRLFVRQLLAINNRVHQILLPRTHLAIGRQQSLQQHLNSFQAGVSNTTAAFRDGVVQPEQQSQLIGVISEAKVHISEQLQLELENAVTTLERLAGLTPHQN